MRRLITLPLLFLAACNSKPTGNDLALGYQRLTVMTFNVENLFDTVNDPQKNDDTFLPKETKLATAISAKCKAIAVQKWQDQCVQWDWNEEALAIKLKKISQVIRSAERGQGPDIIFFQEVENRAVLERLRTEYLAELGYQEAILLEGTDARGIDTGILTKFPPLTAPQLHPIVFTGAVPAAKLADTREILRVTIDVFGEPVTLLNVHFPAPFHPPGMRKDAFATLNTLLQKSPPAQLVIAAGDFNLPRSEDQKLQTLAQLVDPHWHISQHLGCQNCQGTSYYPPTNDWSFLDMILVAKKNSRQSRWTVDPSSVAVFKPMDFQQKAGVPWAFTMPGSQGLSDHWPVILTLVRNQQKPAQTAQP